MAGQQELVTIARKYDVRLMGPNIWVLLHVESATFCGL
jgi:acyl-CoA synthetase (NDP forming)